MVKTNFRPFTWLYKACYNAAIKIVVHFLKRQPEIVAIYLSSSMAAGDYIYGLSDIDFIIIVNDDKESKLRAGRLYEKLSRLIPLLRDEITVFSTAEIRRGYEQGHLFIKYKFFTECKKKGRLLYGIDILSEFEELNGIQRNEFILGQLTFIWSIFLKNFLMAKNMPDTLMRNYLCYKMTSDTCKVFISSRNNQEIFNRKAALECAAAYLDRAPKIHIEKMQALAKNGFATDIPALLADTYDFYTHMLQSVIEHLPRIEECAADKEIPSRVYFDFENIDFIITDKNKHKMKALVELIQKKYNERIRSVLVCPFDILHNNPLDEEHISLFIVPEKPLSFEAITEFKAIIESDHSPQHLYLYMLTSDMAVSLGRFDPEQAHSALCPLEWMDITVLLYLSSPSSVLLGQPLKYDKTKKLVKNYFSQGLLDWLPKHETLVRESVSNSTLIRWPAIEFQAFFWHALRVKLLQASGSSEKIFIPLSSKQVYQQYKATDPDSHWLEEFHEEYKKGLGGIASSSEKYFLRAIAFLKKIYQVDGAQSNSNTPDNKLTISVVIPTFNRAMILKEALESLVAQTRKPDEVVVVDNNSSDNTKEVVENFNHGFNVIYVLEPRQGTSTARNTGIKKASGDIVVFIDDDCVADREWLHHLELPFLRDPSIGLVGGEILGCRVKGTLVEDYCIADALLRVGFR